MTQQLSGVLCLATIASVSVIAPSVNIVEFQSALFIPSAASKTLAMLYMCRVESIELQEERCGAKWSIKDVKTSLTDLQTRQILSRLQLGSQNWGFPWGWFVGRRCCENVIDTEM